MLSRGVEAAAIRFGAFARARDLGRELVADPLMKAEVETFEIEVVGVAGDDVAQRRGDVEALAHRDQEVVEFVLSVFVHEEVDRDFAGLVAERHLFGLRDG